MADTQKRILFVGYRDTDEKAIIGIEELCHKDYLDASLENVEEYLKNNPNYDAVATFNWERYDTIRQMIEKTGIQHIILMETVRRTHPMQQAPGICYHSIELPARYHPDLKKLIDTIPVRNC